MEYATFPIKVMIVFVLSTPMLSYLTERRFKGKVVACWCIVGLIISLLAFVRLIGVITGTTFIYSGLLVIDPFSIFFSIVFTLVATFVALASYEYMHEDPNQGEYYTLLLLATLGMVLVAFSADFLALFVALELMSISTYILICFRKKDPRSNEAAIKYFIISALGSVIILYAISLTFGVVGSTNIYAIAEGFRAGKYSSQPLAFLSVVLFTAGVGLEMAIVPFHMWIPDAYDGAPTTVSALLAGGSKKAGFAAALRIFLIAVIALHSNWSAIFTVLAVFTMTLGNVAALAQTRITRMLAYSSITQAGYILIGLATVNLDGVTGYMMHVLNHALMSSTTFIAAATASHVISAYTLDDYAGLAKRLPVTAFAFTVAMFSLAGIPPFCGFSSKLVLFTAALDAKLGWLALIGVLNSAFSLGYYIRVIKCMYIDLPKVKVVQKVSEPLPFKIALIMATFLIFLLGIYPAISLDFARAAASNLKI